MNILTILSQNTKEDVLFTEDEIYQLYCIKFKKITFEVYKDVFKKFIGQTTLAPIQKSYLGYELTDFGFFCLEYYRKIKAELIAMQKYGELKDLFSFIAGFRTLMNYNLFNLDVNPFYDLLRYLRKSISLLKEKGDELFLESDFNIKLESIHNIIDQLLLYQQTSMQNYSFNIQDHTNLLGILFKTIKEILNLYSNKFDSIFNGRIRSRQSNPYPIIERYIFENWDKKDWKSIFYSSENSSMPSKVLIPFSRDILEKTFKKKLLSSPIVNSSDLPVKINEITRISIKELKIKENLYRITKDLIFDKLYKNNYDLDYDVFKNEIIEIFFKDLLSFYSLAFEKKIHVFAEILKIKDKERKVKYFTARKFRLNKDN